MHELCLCALGNECRRIHLGVVPGSEWKRSVLDTSRRADLTISDHYYFKDSLTNRSRYFRLKQTIP